MKKRKFTKGALITDPMDAFEAILTGKYLFWRHKPQHPGWLSAMQLNSLRWAVRAGLISHAIPTESTPQAQDLD